MFNSRNKKTALKYLVVVRSSQYVLSAFMTRYFPKGQIKDQTTQNQCSSVLPGENSF
jgi:hypothetical protein